MWSMYPSEIHPSALTLDIDGNIYISGYYTNSIVIGDTMLVTYDEEGSNFISKYKSNGVFLWARDKGKVISSISSANDSFDNVYFVGGYEYAVNFDTMNIYSHSLYNSNDFFAKYTNNIWVNEVLPFSKNTISIAPNPAINEIKVGFVYGNSNKIFIVDVYGKQVYYQEVRNVSSYKLELPDLPNGVYFLHIVGDSRNECKKFVIRK